MNTVTVLANALAALPTDPDEIAQVLATEGCYDHRGKYHSCPLVAYFEKVVPHVGRVEVIEKAVNTTTGTYLSVRNPPGIEAFIRRLDAGGFSHLIIL